MARGGVASTNGRPQQSGRKNTRVRHLRLEHSVSVLFEREFWLHFHIPDSIPIQLTNDEAMSSANLPSNMIVLDMLFQLDFYLLEVLFIYTVKMSKKERFGLFSHILSLQLVTDLPDSCKGWAKGHVLVSGPWSGSSEGPDKVRLEEWERKRQERTLRQASVAGCPSSSSVVHPPTEKRKESIARPVQRVITTKKQHILENNSHEFHIF
ncbi:hypothetical protein CK203_116547 [Vitis vinifera]|uniref:Uncharacterized protein n=1 Tax=Vitis vinifera TaxID=29760 RepID=A0A438C430_VITVI|nr:hypothetical protein CK203_116547 [Vitis vinifera]